MTIVCAITDGERTWIGSDRQVTTNGDMAIQLREGRWTELPSGWWVGHSGWSRMTNLIELCTADDYSPCELAAAVRDHVKADGWKPSDVDEGPVQHNGRLVLAKPGEVWTVDSSLAVLRHPDHELAAIGDADQFAVGAAHGFRAGVTMARDRHGVHPRTYGQIGPMDLVHEAIQAARRYSAGCGMGGWYRELAA
jgi:ATP-dependent protease HslVU (ClpYQ) peptidase subunit